MFSQPYRCGCINSFDYDYVDNCILWSLYSKYNLFLHTPFLCISVISYLCTFTLVKSKFSLHFKMSIIYITLVNNILHFYIVYIIPTLTDSGDPVVRYLKIFSRFSKVFVHFWVIFSTMEKYD